jgi:hypothetical protein
MSIEIKELIIKTTIVDRAAGGEDAPAVGQAVKDQILAECRQLVAELLRERGER